MISLDIVIVNWNAGGQLHACLESIAGVDCSNFEIGRVIVVDNNSTDGSIDGLPKINLPLLIIRNQENRGFAAACNEGARESNADYLLFLNPDSQLTADSLSKPIRFMEDPENHHTGICGIQLLDEQGQVSRTCAEFPDMRKFIILILGLDKIFSSLFRGHFMKEWDHNNNRIVAQVMGAFFLVRGFLFDSFGGFDERFFVYFEEVDFSLRLRAAGWHNFYLAEAQAMHKGGGTSEQVKAKRLFYSLRSRVLYGYKHFPPCSARGLLLLTLFIEPWTRLVQAVTRLSASQIIETVQAYAMLWGDLPHLLRKAKKV